MGILADIFVATPTDALRNERTTTARQPFVLDTFERGHVTTGDGDTWLEQFPDAHVAALAILDDAHVPK